MSDKIKELLAHPGCAENILERVHCVRCCIWLTKYLSATRTGDIVGPATAVFSVSKFDY